jgi:hypothetical protein
VLYIAFSAVLTVVLYHLIVQQWLAGILSDAVATSLTWVLAAPVVILAVFGVMGELRGALSYSRALNLS